MKLKSILTILVLGIVVQSYACKCGGPGAIKEEFRRTDLIVHGKVISKDTVKLFETVEAAEVSGLKERLRNDKQRLQHFEMQYVVKVVLEIIEKYKGEAVPRTVVIYTPLFSSACGFRFQKGGDYIVYASTRNFFAFLFQKDNETARLERKDTFWTIHCTRTTEYEKTEAEELRLLKK